MVPAVSTLETMLPPTVPSRPDGEDADLRGAAAEGAAQREGDVDEEFSGAGHHQRGAEHQEADHGVGEGLDRNAEQAFARQHVIGGGLLERRLGAAERPEPFGRRRTADRRVNGNTLSSRLQPPVRRSASISTTHITRPAAITCVGAPSNSQPTSRRLADVASSARSPPPNVSDEQDDVVPGTRSSARLLRSRKDQERERQHQRDQRDRNIRC